MVHVFQHYLIPKEFFFKDFFFGRYAEFSKAVVQMGLGVTSPTEPSPTIPKVVYYGVFRDDGDKAAGATNIHKKVLADLETQVFNYWDALPTTPPRARPRPQVNMCVEGLQLLSSTERGPVWPETLDSKFPANSAEAKEIQELKQKFKSEFPEQVSVPAGGATNGAATVRASGQPDFSVDEGREPLDGLTFW